MCKLNGSGGSVDICIGVVVVVIVIISGDGGGFQ